MNRKELERLFPEFPEFGTGDLAVSTIPVSRVTSWRKFEEALSNSFFERPGIDLIFRGQRRCDWGLTPSLARLDPNYVISQQSAERQLRLFRQAVRGRLADMALVEEAEKDELWSVGQHHGLMTPVLDWTASPYVALYFAFADEDPREETKKNHYRAIYVVNKTYLEEAPPPDNGERPVRIYEPKKDDYGRLVNQAGLFTVCTYGNTFENLFMESLQQNVLGEQGLEDETKLISTYIAKILIPNKDRMACLHHLAQMNVHAASLFPDLLGASQFCNYKLSVWASTLPAPTPEAEEAPKEYAETVTASSSGKASVIETTVDEDGLEKAIASSIPAGEIGTADINRLVEAIEQVIRQRQVVDWYSRENILAYMRNAVRRVLRKFELSPETVEILAIKSVAVAAAQAKSKAENIPIEFFTTVGDKIE